MPTSKKKTDQNINANFICDCDKDWMRSACEGFGFYKEKDGKRYCVLHYPDKDKSEDFKKALQQKLDAKDFNFSGVWFPDEVNFFEFEFTNIANFSSATFSAYADFISATFSASADFSSATFSAYADFISATFSASAYFISATFSASAYFSSATFSAYAYFISATFSASASFSSATFSAYADFSSATFESTVDFSRAVFQRKAFANFYNTRFKDKVLFEKNTFAVGYPLGLDGAIFEKPDRVTFHTVVLHPFWFVNVESRKFNFVNVDWRNQNKKIRIELLALKKKLGITNPHRLLGIAARQLAVNAEENNRYGEAANFRYMAMKVRSLETRRRGCMGLRLLWRFIKDRRSLHFWKRLWVWRKHLDLLHSLYGFASGWGESISRAFVVLILIMILFAGIYWWRSDVSWWQKPKTEQSQTTRSPNEGKLEAMIYSTGVMLFQKPEPLPANKRARFLVYLETVLGPLQAALLALAIRRKFMR